MKNFKRKLAGFLVFAMVLGIMAPGVVAEGEETSSPYTITADYEDETVEVSYPSVSVSAIQYTEVKTADTKADSIADNKWETAEVLDSVTRDGETTATVDISWAKKKGTFILFKFVAADKTVVHTEVLSTPAQVTSLKVALIPSATTASISNKVNIEVKEGMATGSEEEGYIVVYNTKADPVAGTGANTVVSPSTIQWKKGTSGNWYEMSSLPKQLKTFKAKGATLYFRVKGDDKNWVSKEVKFAYKKQANAPSVTVDVNTYTIKLKAGQEYMVAGSSEWIPVEKATTTTIDKLEKVNGTSKEAIGLTDLYAGKRVVVSVRTAANPTKGTIPSKTNTLDLGATSPAALSTTVTTDSSVKSGVVVSYQNPTDNTSGLVITNYDNVAYQYRIVAAGTAATDTTTKWTNLKAKGTKDSIAVKIAANKVDTTKVLQVRLAGIKAVKANPKKNIAASPAELASGPQEVSLTGIPVKELSVTAAALVAPTSGVTVETTGTTAATITVSGSAVSTAALAVQVDFTVENFQKGTKVTVKDASTVTGAKATVDTAGKVSLKFSVPKEKTATETLTVTVGKMEVKVKLNIDLSK